MSPTGTDSEHNGDSHAAEDIDTGEPIEQLADLQVAPRRGFLGRVRKRIERRRLSAEVTRLAWSAPITVLLELLDALFQTLAGDRPEEKNDEHR